jgi:hypothetical protein
MVKPPFKVRLRRVARLFTADGFALAPIWLQLLAIFAASAGLIFLSSALTHSLSLSYRMFTDASSYAEAEGFRQLFFGFFEVCLGLILFSSIISVLSAALEQLIERIRGGTRPYRGAGHVLIVNQNPKLPLILDEINERYGRRGVDVDIVVLLGDRAELNKFNEGLDLHRWPCLHILVRQGDLLAFETYERVSIRSAAGIILLSSSAGANVFENDNRNLKILTTLVNDAAFWAHLVAHQESHRPIKCAIELSSELQSRAIARALTTHGREALFSVTTPGDVIGRVLSRCVIDIVYYRIYYEIFSFYGHTIYFVDPKQFAAQGVASGSSFEEMNRGFVEGVLIGFSRVEHGELQIRLAPFGQKLMAGDWLLIIARTAESVRYQRPSSVAALDGAEIVPPSEFHHRRLCVVGNARPFERLAAFLDGDSQARLKDAHVFFEDARRYFEPDVIARLRDGNFDSIIVNLEDEAGFRFTLYLLAQFKPQDPFLEKIVTVLSDPVIERLLNGNAKFKNTILSDNLAAKYITQLAFQKNLEKVYDELSAPEGFEFNLLDVETHIPRAALTSKAEVKDRLLARGLIYVGAVDAQKVVTFDAENFAGAQQLVVISRGRS